MSLKRTDLAKNLNLKIQGQMQHAGVPSRFAQGAALPDRREQRKLDQAAGLVPFAVKLNKELVARLGDLASARQVTLNAFVDEVLRAGLAQLPAATVTATAPQAPKKSAKPAAEKVSAAPAPKAPANKAASKPAAKQAAEKAPVKKAAAKKAAAQKTAAKTASKTAAKTATKTAKKAAR